MIVPLTTPDTDLPTLDTHCPATRTMVEHVTSKWGVLVLLVLDGATLRWSEVKRAIPGVSEKMLIQTLQTLEADGLVRRDALPVVPPHVEYSLTEDGQEASRMLRPLVLWAQGYAQGHAQGNAQGNAQGR